MKEANICGFCSRPLQSEDLMEGRTRWFCPPCERDLDALDRSRLSVNPGPLTPPEHATRTQERME